MLRGRAARASAALAGVLLSYLKVAISSPGCESGLRVLLSYLKVAIFKPQLPTSRTTFVLKSCDLRALAAKVDFAYYFCT